jgi:hypothetical protein
MQTTIFYGMFGEKNLNFNIHKIYLKLILNAYFKLFH